MKRFNGSAIPRYQVFTLSDGTFVVQWRERQVQELMTGQYRNFDYKHDFGHAITNYELAQLKTSGRVEHYNKHHIWMYPLPEAGRFGQRRALHDVDTQNDCFFIATQLPSSQVSHITKVLDDLNITAVVQDDIVIVLNADELPFTSREEAETVQESILALAPETLGNLSIQFFGIKNPTTILMDDTSSEQQDTDSHEDKLIILALQQEDEIQAFSSLLNEMQIEIKQAQTSDAAMLLLEDHDVDLFIMDIALPDLHGWKMISKIREVDQLRDLPITVITDQPNFGVTVANVSYLVRPVSIARLRHNVLTSIRGNDLLDREK